jgi:hypothetical protein
MECQNGSKCNIDCPVGGCIIKCGWDTICNIDCPAGDCIIDCGTDALCDIECPQDECMINTFDGGIADPPDGAVDDCGRLLNREPEGTPCTVPPAPCAYPATAQCDGRGNCECV